MIVTWICALRDRLWECLSGGIYYLSGSEGLPAPLGPQAEQEALTALKAGDALAQDTLIRHNLRLVVFIARKFDNTGVALEDLVSIGTIGLIKAVRTFDPDKKIKLATYASRCIENEILMHLRRTSRLKAEVSLDEPLHTDWDGNELHLGDILGTEEDLVFQPLEREAETQLLHEALSHLNERELLIMNLRFGLNGYKERTQKEVAGVLGISQSYISRLEKRVIRRLREEMERMA